MKRLANRTDELASFQKMVRGEMAHRILLIQAASGYGKTGLMGRFAEQCPTGTIAVRLDLKAAAGYGIAYVFYRICKTLKDHRFPNYEKAIAKFLYPDRTVAEIEISGNELSGDQSTIQVVLAGQSEEERRLRLQQVQSAFFKDLRQCRSAIVFILDTFNEATPELKGWVAGPFLMEVADHETLYCVVAGQEVPEVSIEWERLHHTCCLKPIREHEAWYRYARDEGYLFEQMELGVLVDLYQGVPNSIAQGIQTLFQNRQAS
jgi:hypothetical protein